jgi:hypothetical protein
MVYFVQRLLFYILCPSQQGMEMEGRETEVLIPFLPLLVMKQRPVTSSTTFHSSHKQTNAER